MEEGSASVRAGPGRDVLARGIALGFVVAALLLLRLVFDLGRGDVVFAVVAGSFYAAFLGLELVLVRAAWSGSRGPELSRRARLGLGLAVPFALVAASLDCMGLSLDACTTTCAFVTKGVASVVAALVLAGAATGGDGWLRACMLVSFGLLIPNCVCRNPVNRYWIDLLGYSPACCLSAFTVTLVAASALFTRRYTAVALVFVWGTIAVLYGFFVGHHYFRWPW